LTPFKDIILCKAQALGLCSFFYSKAQLGLLIFVSGTQRTRAVREHAASAPINGVIKTLLSFNTAYFKVLLKAFYKIMRLIFFGNLYSLWL
jgi:hypothetical protein